MAWSFNPVAGKRMPPISGLPAAHAREIVADPKTDTPDAIRAYILAQIDYYVAKHGETVLISVSGYGHADGSVVEVRKAGDAPVPEAKDAADKAAAVTA